MSTLIAESGDLGRAFLELAARTVCGPGYSSREVMRSEMLSHVNYLSEKEGGIPAEYIHTPVFDGFQILTENSSFEMDRLCRAISEPYAQSEGLRDRDVVLAKSSSSAPDVILLEGRDGPAVGGALCHLAQGRLVMLASRSLQHMLPDEICRVIGLSASVFAIRLSSWSETIVDFVYGAISDPPPVVLGYFERDEDISLACEGISKVVHSEGSMLDTRMTRLFVPLARHAAWSVVLNLGDKGFEDAVFGTCRMKGAAVLATLQEILQSRIALRVGGELEGRTVQLPWPLPCDAE